MSLFGSLGSLAAGVLAKYGNTTAVLTRTTPGVYDPSTGNTAAGSSASYSVPAVADSSSLRTLGIKYGEAFVQAGDLDVTVPASGLPITPAPGDSVQLNGETWQVMQVQSSPAAENAVVHQLLVRR